ncbi:MAG: hypothetical protein JOY96_00120 [Verrucomicrobia bacterium]|nr:hypothetical protein [Verrucomicrobiota bacterium]MBV9672198.1 hypothetical protein [Verrucomicrobiota bacterium]
MPQQTEPVTSTATENANKFVFHDHEDATHVVYYPQAPGPIPSDPTKRGARLDYEGPEGTFSFLGDQIENQAGPLGSLITVALERSIDAGELAFSLVLPPVNMGTEQRETFHTVAIKTKSFGILIKKGARLTYTLVHLKGVAELVILPL